MKNEVRIKYLLPAEIQNAFNRLPLAIIPCGVLEWHSLHLPFGTDIINAEKCSIEAAIRVGGVVFPPIFFGTCESKSKKSLLRQGFKGNENIVGIDHPNAKGLFKSFYYSDKLITMSLKETVQHIIEHKYKYICVVTGHASPHHCGILNSIADFFNKSVKIKILIFIALNEIEHAAIQETSLMEYYDVYVNKSLLPDKPEKLKYTEYSIMDEKGLIGLSNDDYACEDECDPRNSTKEIGNEIFQSLMHQLCSKIDKLIK